MKKNLKNVDVAFSYAAGKVILVGEHAVVYGARAIAVPIEVGIRLAISSLDHEHPHHGPLIKGVGTFFMGDVWLGKKESMGPSILRRAFEYLIGELGEKIRRLTIVVDGNLVPGRGLGSSASFSVALIRGLYRYFSWPLSNELLMRHALALETIFHGSPSGIDHNVVIGEKIIGFKKHQGRCEAWPIIVKSPFKFLVGVAGPHEGTKNAVSSLRERRKRHEKAYDAIFAGLDDIALEMEKALIEGHLVSVGELMNIAQGYLNALSISTPEIEKLCSIAREHGALGAKLTGAGGGGAVIALVDGNEKELMGAFKAAGYQSFITEVFGSSKR